MNDVDVLGHIQAVRSATAVDLVATVVHCKTDQGVVVLPMVFYKIGYSAEDVVV